eukprot:TRINITY_DN7441_c0_g1_i10.p1 TRINITY_DN7441_c0_g1~~TRINITY_DN7441_c0_g1_i10.p1  ORF type:complete len:820 (-),score=131.71 TRINITY_DN7441_c0_g1_i10:366-2825(-)
MTSIDASPGRGTLQEDLQGSVFEQAKKETSTDDDDNDNDDNQIQQSSQQLKSNNKNNKYKKGGEAEEEEFDSAWFRRRLARRFSNAGVPGKLEELLVSYQATISPEALSSACMSAIRILKRPNQYGQKQKLQKVIKIYDKVIYQARKLVHKLAINQVTTCLMCLGDGAATIHIHWKSPTFKKVFTQLCNRALELREEVGARQMVCMMEAIGKARFMKQDVVDKMMGMALEVGKREGYTLQMVSLILWGVGCVNHRKNQESIKYFVKLFQQMINTEQQLDLNEVLKPTRAKLIEQDGEYILQLQQTQNEFSDQDTIDQAQEEETLDQSNSNNNNNNIMPSKNPENSQEATLNNPNENQNYQLENDYNEPSLSDENVNDIRRVIDYEDDNYNIENSNNNNNINNGIYNQSEEIDLDQKDILFLQRQIEEENEKYLQKSRKKHQSKKIKKPVRIVEQKVSKVQLQQIKRELLQRQRTLLTIYTGQIMWALRVIGYYDKSLVQTLEKFVLDKKWLNTKKFKIKRTRAKHYVPFDTQTISSLALSCADLGIRHPEMMQVLVKRFLNLLKEKNQQDVASLVYALAVMRFPVKVPQAIIDVCTGNMSGKQSFSAFINNSLWKLKRAQLMYEVRNEELRFPLVLYELANDISRKRVHTYVHNEREFPNKIFHDIYKELDQTQPTYDHFNGRYEEEMQYSLIKVEQNVVIKDGFIGVDVFVRRFDKKTMQPFGQEVVVWGLNKDVSCKCTKPYDILGCMFSSLWLLQKLGYQVVVVYEHRWDDKEYQKDICDIIRSYLKVERNVREEIQNDGEKKSQQLQVYSDSGLV